MSLSGEDKLISLLAEIHSDIRQIKSDLQSLISLLKEQQERQHLRRFPVATTRRTPSRARSQARLKTSFAICGKREGRMIWEKPVSMPLLRECRFIAHFSRTRSRLWCCSRPGSLLA
jgi:hypothetical protein